MDNTKRCAACAMEIPATADKCPHCRTRQPGAPPMHRGLPGKMLAGVCTAVANEFGVDVSLVRVLLAVAALFSGGLACAAYLVLWAVTPPGPQGSAPFTRFMDWLHRLTSPTTAPKPQQPA